jgi:hypothetical protein
MAEEWFPWRQDTPRIKSMDSTDAVTWISVIAAGASAVAAIGAWKAGSKASKAAEALTKIEAARQWEHLTPQFSCSMELLNPGGPFMRLVLELNGPLALERLESLTARIRDDRPGRADEAQLGNGPTADQIRAQVWGPYRFTPDTGPGASPGTGGADPNGRSVDVAAMPLQVGEGLRFQLEPTRPPSWMVASAVDAASPETNWRQMVGDRLRLSITARSKDAEPWVIPLEIDVGKPVIAF